MNGALSPLGRFQEGAALAVALSVVFVWLFGLAFNPAGVSDTLDNAAWIIIGILFGRQLASSAANATQHVSTKVDAVESRVDAIERSKNGDVRNDP
jgi:hypothetical protein